MVVVLCSSVDEHLGSNFFHLSFQEVLLPLIIRGRVEVVVLDFEYTPTTFGITNLLGYVIGDVRRSSPARNKQHACDQSEEKTLRHAVLPR